MSVAFWRGALAITLFAVPGAAPVTAQVRHVLILQTFDRGSLVFDRFTADFRRELEQRGPPVTFTEFAIAPAGFVQVPEEQIVSFLVGMFASRSAPDLVVTVGGPAASFLRRHRQALFPNTPTIFGAVERRFVTGAPLAPNEMAVPVAIDYTHLIDDVLQVRPRTRHVFVVMGASPLSVFWREELTRNFQRFQRRVTFSWSDTLTFDQAMAQASQLPPDSAILYFFAGTDLKGGWRNDERALSALATRATAPVFGVHTDFLGRGVVGGRLLSSEALGTRTGGVAAGLLKGETPAGRSLDPLTQGPPVYDARQLRRWGISESSLPPGSEIRFRPPGVWQTYRREVLGVMVILTLQSALIGALLYHRRARQRAEMDSRRSLSLAADASRRLTMSTLTGSIAHDLSQPLTAVELNADAGQLLATSGRATPDALLAIFADIRQANERASAIIDRHRAMLRAHRLAMAPVDVHVVVRESLALVAHETRARHVEVEVDLPSAPCIVAGDHVLLQQVLVNLFMNAMDAMSDVGTHRRRLRVASMPGPDSTLILVRDWGTGLPAHLDGEIFQPFKTTKPHGLGIGLTIVRTIIDAHHGTMDAENNPDGGATFRMRLPRSDGAAVGPTSPTKEQ